MTKTTLNPKSNSGQKTTPKSARSRNSSQANKAKHHFSARKGGTKSAPHQDNNASKQDVKVPLQKKVLPIMRDPSLKVKQQEVARKNLLSLGVKEYDPNYYHNSRFQSALIIKEVIEDKKTLAIDLEGIIPAKDIPFVSELAYGVLRNLPRLTFIANKLLSAPLKKNNYFAYFILLQALYQLIYMNKADHAAVYENVELTKKIYGKGVASVINACLRNFMRQQEQLLADSQEVELLPNWLNKLLSQRIPEADLAQVKQAMHQRPPFWIRVNRKNISLEQFVANLKAAGLEFEQHPNLPTAIRLLNPVPVEKIPGFSQGHCVVQDLHAQFAAVILTQPTIANGGHFALDPRLNLANCNQVLVEHIIRHATGKIQSYLDDKEPLIVDACCSPGGKTIHLLDLIPEGAKLIASDIDSIRLQRVYENLERNKFSALVVEGDASKPDSWLPQSINALKPKDNQVNAILLDVPCSGTGVIRRHPDIKWLRKPDDIERLSELQLEILSNQWKYLRVGGKLLYTSCSILGQENEEVVKKFLAQTPNAKVIETLAFETISLLSQSQKVQIDGPGLQLVNSENSGDGFYYCLLTKTHE